MPTPEPPQRALSATETAENPLSGLPQPEGPRWALYARSTAAAERPVRTRIRPSDDERAERQLALLRELVAGEGGTVVAEYIDRGRPGGAGLAALLQAASAGELDRIAVVDLVRFGRQAHLMRTCDVLYAARVPVTLLNGTEINPADFSLASVRIEREAIERAEANR